MPTQDEIQDWLIIQIADVVYVDQDEINIRSPFSSFGLSSKDAVILSGDLEDWLDRRLSPTIVYEYPTIESLAEYLSTDGVPGKQSKFRDEIDVDEKHDIGSGEKGEHSSEQQSAIDLEKTVSNLEKLTDTEAEALLLEKLNSMDHD